MYHKTVVTKSEIWIGGVFSDTWVVVTAVSSISENEFGLRLHTLYGSTFIPWSNIKYTEDR